MEGYSTISASLGRLEADTLGMIGRLQARLDRTAHDRWADDGGACRDLDACVDCGAEVYRDGTHVVDQHSRAMLGYPACTAL